VKFFAACFLFLALLISSSNNLVAQEQPAEDSLAIMSTLVDTAGHTEDSPAAWSVLPFILLLLMTATGPLFYAHFWHKNYKLIALLFGVLVVLYYVFFLHNYHNPVHALAEYASFISLLTALFVASGGIVIKVDTKGTPLANSLLLVAGAALANIIGTTGASMLLIRPFMRLNKDRIEPYHIVFFIFIVSNVGGCLTPIGDPPLFIGFLKGVPFFWTVEHLWVKWFFGVGLLTLIFYIFDKTKHPKDKESFEHSGKIGIQGTMNLLWLGVVILSVFLDPNLVDWLPYIPYHGDKISFVREAIMLTAAYFSYRTSDKDCLKANEFNFEPIKEVAFLFAGIFMTMMPALQLISEFARAHGEAFTQTTLFWGSGVLSSVLDNAPTYLNFLSAGLGRAGLSIEVKEDVVAFALGTTPMGIDTVERLIAVSVGSVFFGACTYIGNAPNFMVKAIAEQAGIKMPSFFGYVFRYTIPFLLPVLFLTWLVFIYFGVAV